MQSAAQGEAGPSVSPVGILMGQNQDLVPFPQKGRRFLDGDILTHGSRPFFQLIELLCDAGAVFDGIVRYKTQLRHMAQVQGVPQLPADVALSTL